MAGMTLQVDKCLVEPVIKAQIQAAIVRELGQTERLVEKVVAQALTVKVNSEGKHSKSSYRNEFTYLNWLTGDVIRRAAKEAIREYIEEVRDEIKVEVAKQIRKRSNDFATALVSGLADALKASWRFDVKVGFDSPDND